MSYAYPEVETAPLARGDTPADAFCHNCMHHNPDTLECRRYAPRPDGRTARVVWPAVVRHDWCGEFVQASTTPEGGWMRQDRRHPFDD